MAFRVTVDEEKCQGCEECVEVCTVHRFEIRQGKSVPVYAGECLGCQSCAEICKQDAITVVELQLEMSDTCRFLLREIL